MPSIFIYTLLSFWIATPQASPVLVPRDTCTWQGASGTFPCTPKVHAAPVPKGILNIWRANNVTPNSRRPQIVIDMVTTAMSTYKDFIAGPMDINYYVVRALSDGSSAQAGTVL